MSNVIIKLPNSTGLLKVKEENARVIFGGGDQQYVDKIKNRGVAKT